MNKVYVVNHTHFDREWYRTKSEYQMILKRGVEYLVNQFESGDINKFFFDGQTIIVEDLKEVLSEQNFTKFINLIKRGDIEIGPFYVLADEALIDEAGFNINLKLGQKICHNLGVKDSGVLYLPDTFGHSSAMPKIANNFNLSYAVIHRGIMSDQIDVTWQFNDSYVKTVCLPTREGYYQTAFHHDDFIDKFDKYCCEYLSGNENNDILYLNGCDHTFPPNDFKEKLEKLRVEFKDKYEIVEVTLSEFFNLNNYKYEKIVKGELRDKGRAFLLPGVLSTRQYLKRDNRYCIDNLVRYKRLVQYLKLDTESNNINHLEKIIVKNHPHDSICGCSIDEVHNQMQVRSKSALDNIKQSIQIILNNSYPKKLGVFNDQIAIYNHIQQNEYLLDINIDLEEFNEKSNIFLENENGKFLLEYISHQNIEILEHSFNAEPSYINVSRVNVIGNVFLQNMINTFKITVEKIDTDIVEVDKDNLCELCNYHYITDRGDSYNFDPVGEYQKIENVSHTVKEYKQVVIHKIISSCLIEDSINDERDDREGTLKLLSLTTEIKIAKKSNERSVRVSINNVHKNIKVVNIYENIDTVYTDTALDLIKREQIDVINYDAVFQNNEVLYNQHPSLTAILVNNNYQISHIGLNEVEKIDNKLIHTLFRATGDLSRRDLLSRRGGAGPSYKTNDCQCLTKMEFEYLITNTNKYLKDEHLKIYAFIVHQYKGE